MKNLQVATSTVVWLKAAGVRALRTFAQASIAAIGTNAVGILEVDWLGVLSIASVAAILSILTSLANIPEVN
jgi:hypothetical protein